MLTDISRQVMWNRLISVVEEQALSLVRSAFSTSVREAGDLSAGIFDEHGQMLAQAVTGTPGHVNSMAEAVPHFIAAIGKDNLFEDDVYITNDPWRGTGHLHDITVVSPAFYNGRLVGFLACTGHVVDIGGRGFGADAREVYEEGLFIPIMKLRERGALNRTLIEIVRNNVRESDKVIGDIHALAGCCRTGWLRLRAMFGDFGIDNLEEIGAFILENTRAAMLHRIASLPRGTCQNRMTLDGYDRPITLSVRVAIEPDRVVADFSGTSGPSPFGINVPLCYTKAYASFGLKCALAPEIPNNSASLAFFRVEAPSDCILNAQRPAPVSVRHVLGHFVPELILGALHELLPDQIPAEGAGALWNIHCSVRPKAGSARHGGAELLMFNSGGMGARPHLDGLSTTAFPSGVQTMSTEATENVGPLVVWRKELRPGSGGAGEHRGGLGQVIELGCLPGYSLQFSAMFDRIHHPARGRDGGADGAPGNVRLDNGTVLRGKGFQAVSEGARLIIELPGGGGYGPPSKRSRAGIQYDLRNGYISAAQARDLYKMGAD
jgi:N-methylhydantoinase B